MYKDPSLCLSTITIFKNYALTFNNDLVHHFLQNIFTQDFGIIKKPAFLITSKTLNLLIFSFQDIRN